LPQRGHWKKKRATQGTAVGKEATRVPISIRGGNKNRTDGKGIQHDDTTSEGKKEKERRERQSTERTLALATDDRGRAMKMAGVAHTA
jgi:hypothetical protein